VHRRSAIRPTWQANASSQSGLRAFVRVAALSNGRISSNIAWRMWAPKLARTEGRRRGEYFDVVEGHFGTRVRDESDVEVTATLPAGEDSAPDSRHSSPRRDDPSSACRSCAASSTADCSPAGEAEEAPLLERPSFVLALLHQRSDRGDFVVRELDLGCRQVGPEVLEASGAGNWQGVGC